MIEYNFNSSGQLIYSLTGYRSGKYNFFCSYIKRYIHIGNPVEWDKVAKYKFEIREKVL